MLKSKKTRFQPAIEKRQEFQAGNYLSNILANEDKVIMKEHKNDIKKKAFEKGKGRGYEVKPMKARHYILKRNDLEKQSKYKR